MNIMNNVIKKVIFVLCLTSFCFTYSIHAQKTSENINGHFTGSYENITQYYMKDTSIGAFPTKEKIASNGFFKLDYNNGNFSSGIQYESYMPAINGYFAPSVIDATKSKIVNKYFKYTKDHFYILAGDFYEQFGSGLIYRSYENRQIGINNALEGFKAYVEPTDFMKVKVIYGRTREVFDYSNALTRGVDAEININSLIRIIATEKTPTVSIGGSYVSKFQGDYTGPDDIPLEVNAFATRLDFTSNSISINAEYVDKSKDPHLVNNMSFKKGSAFQVNSSFTKNNFGANVSFRSLTNMDFRSNRDQEFASIGPLNFLPSLTKQHDNLTSNIYIYNTQPKGESGIQSDVYYTIKSGTKLGGKYGTTISGNLSYIESLNDSSELLSFGKTKYFKDANLEIKKKWNKKLETTISYQSIFFKAALQSASRPNVNATVIAGGMIYKFKPKKSLRIKLEHLAAANDQGNWASALTEFSFSSPYAFFASDLFNYGDTKDHYYNVGTSVTKQSTRFSLAFGKQRAGLFCVGGVCRFVPAAFGFTASLTTTFSN